MDEKKGRPVRMTLELSPKVRERLQDLSAETDQSLSEVIRRALAVYDFILTESLSGNLFGTGQGLMGTGGRSGECVTLSLPGY